MISVVIPIYNKEKDIKHVISSLRRQTYKDIEIILVNDGSTDNSYKIAKSYEDREKIFVYSQDNQGVSSARNTGIAHSHGEWLSFLDPDDQIAEDYFATLIKFSHNYDIIACCCYAVNGNQKRIDNFFPYDMIFEDNNKYILFRQLLDDKYMQSRYIYTAIGVPWGKLYRRSLILENNIMFNTKLKKQEDNVFNMYAFKYARKIYYLNKPLYYYFIEHIKNDYVSTYDKYAILNAIELQKERFTFFHKNNILTNNEGREFFDNATISLLISSFNKCLLNKHNNLTYQEKKAVYHNTINMEFFRIVIRYLDIDKINGLVHKVVAFSMKRDLFYPINFIWHFRSIYVKIKYRNY